MDDIGLVIGWFIVAFILHMILYRVFFRWKLVLFLLSGLYFLGVPIVILKHIYFPMPGIHLLLSSCFISIILATIVTLFYFPRLLQGQTPSTILLLAFAKRSVWSKKELFDLFSENELVNSRLLTLERQNFIRKEERRYYVTRKGSIFFSGMSFFLACSGMEVGG